MDSLDIVCTIDNNYVEHCAVMLRSLTVNNPNTDIKVLIISSALADQKRIAFEQFLSGFCSRVGIVIVGDRELADAPVSRHVSVAAYFRVLIPQLVDRSINKILYLDADMVVRRSILPLWNIELAEHTHAAAENPGISREYKCNLGVPQETPYFNSGVMLINLRAWREIGVTEKCIDFIRRHRSKIKYWDQDVLNYILQGRWLRIESKWNAQHAIFNSMSGGMLGLNEAEFQEAKSDPTIVHFSGSAACKPWHYRCDHPFKQEYYRYRYQTPWRRFIPVGKPTLTRRIYSQARRIFLTE